MLSLLNIIHKYIIISRLNSWLTKNEEVSITVLKEAKVLRSQVEINEGGRIVLRLLNGNQLVLCVRELFQGVYTMEVGLVSIEAIAKAVLEGGYGAVRIIEAINNCSKTGVGTVISGGGEVLVGLSVPIDINRFCNEKEGLKCLKEVMDDIDRVITKELEAEIDQMKDEDSIVLENEG